MKFSFKCSKNHCCQFLSENSMSSQRCVPFRDFSSFSRFTVGVFVNTVACRSQLLTGWTKMVQTKFNGNWEQLEAAEKKIPESALAHKGMRLQRPPPGTPSPLVHRPAKAPKWWSDQGWTLDKPVFGQREEGHYQGKHPATRVGNFMHLGRSGCTPRH